MTRPAIRVATANVKMAELSGIVTVGPESAAVLTEKLGRTVEPGEQFDLGTLAYYSNNPARRLWRSLRGIRRNPFNS
jgi:hypothetical protein